VIHANVLVLNDFI